MVAYNETLGLTCSFICFSQDKLGLLDTASPDKSSYVEEWANRHCLPPGLESPSSPEGTKSRLEIRFSKF